MKEPTKPLYINGQEPLQVCLDGPALRIRKTRSDDRRFPLERLSRIVVFGDVGWSSDALLACAKAGIVVCLLRPNGLPAECCVGEPSTTSTFAEDWRRFLERTDGQQLFRRWRIRERQRAIRFCALRLGLRRDVPAFARQVGRCATNDPHFGAAKRGLYGLAHARCLEELSKLGLCETDMSLRLVAPHLAAVIQWGLHPSFVDWWRRRATASVPELAGFFERNHSTAEFHLRETLHSLARVLEEKM